jgi:uncharacterized membrane protein
MPIAWQDPVFLPRVFMMDNFLKFAHVLSVVVWVGGMVFAHFFLRPAVVALAPPERLRLMHDVLGRFFKVVLVLSSVVVVSGLWMIGRVAKAAAQSGGAFHMPLSWTLMATLGLVMWAIFGHIRFALFKRLSRAVTATEWPAAGAALASIRLWVSINLGLGLLAVAVVYLLG